MPNIEDKELSEFTVIKCITGSGEIFYDLEERPHSWPFVKIIKEEIVRAITVNKLNEVIDNYKGTATSFGKDLRFKEYLKTELKLCKKNLVKEYDSIGNIQC